MMASLFSTIDFLSTLGTTGFGSGTSGGGSGILTTGVFPVPSPDPPPTLDDRTGGSAFVSETIESERAGGTDDAVFPILSGTLFGFDVLSISSVRVERVGVVAEVDAG